jgi:hypothetical protein
MPFFSVYDELDGRVCRVVASFNLLLKTEDDLTCCVDDVKTVGGGDIVSRRRFAVGTQQNLFVPEGNECGIIDAYKAEGFETFDFEAVVDYFAKAVECFSFGKLLLGVFNSIDDAEAKAGIIVYLYANVFHWRAAL